MDSSGPHVRSPRPCSLGPPYRAPSPRQASGTAPSGPPAPGRTSPPSRRCQPPANPPEPFSPSLTSRPLSALSLTRGRRVNTRWTCCSTAGWCWELPSTLPAGGATPSQQMPGGGPGWRSWTIAATSWRSTMPSRPTAALPALPLAGPSFGGRGWGRDPGPLLRAFISGPGGGWCAPVARCRAGTSGGLVGGWHRRGPSHESCPAAFGVMVENSSSADSRQTAGHSR